MRRRLTLLALAALLPLVALVVGLTVYSVRQQQQAMGEQAIAHAERLLQRVESELAFHLRLLETLAKAPSLDGPAPDLKTFHTVAGRLQRDLRSWNRIILVDLNRQQILNTAVPFGSPLPGNVDEDSFRRVVETRRAVISNVTEGGPLSPGLRQIGLRVPVLDTHGAVRFILTGTLTTDTLADIVASLPIDEAWRPFLIDGADRIIASPRSPETVGQRAGEKAREARSADIGGVYVGATNTGDPVVTAFRKAPESGWSAHIAIPLAIYNAPLHRSLWIVGIFGIGALGLTVAFVVMLRQEVLAEREEAEFRERTMRMDALGRMTGGVAHDFNNLLMVILGNVDLLQRRVGGTQVERYAAGIRKAAERGTQLTRELLAFSRGETGQAEVIDLGERVEAMMAMLRQSLKDNITIQLTVLPGRHLVKVDPIQLDLAILNIAVNARDAMPDGGRITIAIDRTAFPDRSRREGIALAIRDSGSGVPEEVLAHVFEPFFTTKEVGKGTGLGLSQVYGFAKASGGIADIASRVGQGTTVTLYLPEAAGEVPRAAPTPSEQAGGGARSRRGRAIVLDDNSDVRAVTADFLTESGFDVVGVGAPEAALATLESGAVDLLVSDIVMPGDRSGFDLAKEVRLRFPRVPILLMSGYSPSTLEAVRLGFDVLPKPFTVADLAAALQKLFRQQPGAPGLGGAGQDSRAG